jgi:plasmid maintenance system antidote protein VapI
MNRKLKARIVELHGTQADFAKKIEMDESAISRIIRGRKVISAEDKKRWAVLLSSTPEELFYSEEGG